MLDCNDRIRSIMATINGIGAGIGGIQDGEATKDGMSGEGSASLPLYGLG